MEERGDHHLDDREPGDGLILRLSHFEGPIDLLFFLAREQKVDLAQIDVLDLCNQYVAFLAAAEDFDVDRASEWLLMAAWLTFLKSRLLIPRKDRVDDEPEKDAENLTLALKRVDLIRRLAGDLRRRRRLGQDWHRPGATIGSSAPHARGDFNAPGLSEILRLLAEEINNTRTVSIPVMEKKDLVSVDAAIGMIRAQIRGRVEWTDLITLPSVVSAGPQIRSALASHFVGTLELAKQAEIEIAQDDLSAPVYLRDAGAQPDAL